jgi:methionine sulfoxide reductase heme-binding subunit
MVNTAPLRYLNAPVVFWLLLSIPAAWWLYAYWQDTIFYGELLHGSGDLAAQLLIVTLAVTPLGLIFPRAAWVRWLKSRRRYLGVATFGYSLLHTAVYVQRRPDLAYIIEQAREIAMLTGWLALLILLVLASTSNNFSVRLLGHGWKGLHRIVYLAAVLTFSHWILTAFDPVPGIIHMSVLALLEAIRLVMTRFNHGKLGSE